ncbi:hypothetical protein [Nesterenkonia sp. CL21]|uniref:hypothetical protein n=1 Tax=Nesterenkonia sp. CL21 TaxID=3064894 RepID=UPI0037C9F8A8
MLPHVVITVTQTGALDVTVDGVAYPPPAEGQTWTRATFGGLLDAITKDRTVAVRIEVRETDGTVFTDLIHTRKPTAPEPAESQPREPRRKHTKTKRRQTPKLVEVTSEGFVPGEDIAVALVVARTDATGTGHARALIDTNRIGDLLDNGAGEILLFGRVSGTVEVRRLP